jgi:hypothetical protein
VVGGSQRSAYTHEKEVPSEVKVGVVADSDRGRCPGSSVAERPVGGLLVVNGIAMNRSLSRRVAKCVTSPNPAWSGAKVPLAKVGRASRLRLQEVKFWCVTQRVNRVEYLYSPFWNGILLSAL